MCNIEPVQIPRISVNSNAALFGTIPFPSAVIHRNPTTAPGSPEDAEEVGRFGAFITFKHDKTPMFDEMELLIISPPFAAAHMHSPTVMFRDRRVAVSGIEAHVR